MIAMTARGDFDIMHWIGEECGSSIEWVREGRTNWFGNEFIVAKSTLFLSTKWTTWILVLLEPFADTNVANFMETTGKCRLDLDSRSTTFVINAFDSIGNRADMTHVFSCNGRLTRINGYR